MENVHEVLTIKKKKVSGILPKLIVPIILIILWVIISELKRMKQYSYLLLKHYGKRL